MLFVLQFIEKLKQRWLKKNVPGKDGMKYLSIFVIAGAVISILPLFVVGFYNHISGDDWYNGRFVYHQILDGSFSIGRMFSDIVGDLTDLYTRWSFTYTGYFFCYVMPAAFGEKWTWLNSTILLLGTTVCIFFVLKKAFQKLLGLGKNEACIAAALLGIVMIQYMPSAYDGFYWWSGSLNNTIGFAISLLDLLFLLRLYDENAKIKKGNWILFGISLFLIAGTSYATVLVLFCSMILVLMDLWIYKKGTKSRRIWYTILFAFFCVCILFAMSAPGNWRRAATLGDVGYSPVAAIIVAYLEGAKLLYGAFNLCHVLVLACVCVLALPVLIEKRGKFKNPVIVSFVTYSIYVTSFIPTLFAEGIPGELRLRNIQYWYSMILVTINLLYWLGWYLNKKDIRKESSLLANFKIEIILLLGVVCALFMLRGGEEPTAKIALKGLLMGEIQQFDAELDAREEIYLENRGEEVIVEQLSVIPQIFEGYTDVREERFWINSNIRDYYELKRLRSSINGEVVD